MKRTNMWANIKLLALFFVVAALLFTIQQMYSSNLLGRLIAVAIGIISICVVAITNIKLKSYKLLMLDAIAVLLVSINFCTTLFEILYK